MLTIQARNERISRESLAVSLVVVVLAALRLCHIRLLWADEDYHLAAAINLLHAKIPYRDFWYDKPPGDALYYLLIGGHSGWPLRLLDTAYVLVACYLVYQLARAWWGKTEARLSALLLAFFLTFYLPSAVIAFAADALLLVPHLAAMYCAYAKRALLAGVCCAIGFLVNAKALFVLAVCALWLGPQTPLLCAGFAVPVLTFALAALWSGAWHGYLEQVWRWGWIYAAGSPVTHPFITGLSRTANWLGFHVALASAVVVTLFRSTRPDRFKLISWLALSYAAVCLGTRFAPHYFLQLLPPMVVAASRGITVAWRERQRLAAFFLAASLIVPVVRFGPHYFQLAFDNLVGRNPRWIDATLDLDSQAAAHVIEQLAQPTDTLLVWGYRPDIYVYTRLTSDSRFWDSQPLTGVPADRHLHAKSPIYGGPAAQNRVELTHSHPTWLVDGLGPLNPQLAPSAFTDLRAWLANYRAVARTKLCIIYRRIK